MSYSQPPPTNGSTTPDVPAAPPEPGAGAAATPYAQPPAAPPVMPPYGGSVAAFTGVHPGVAASRTATRVIARVVAVVVLIPIVAGSIIAAFVAHDTSGTAPFTLPPITVPDPVPGSFDNPLKLTLGQPFVLTSLSYAGGWKIGKDQVGRPTIKNLRATNRTAAPVVPAIEFKLLKGTTVQLTITCALASIQPGKTERLYCVSTAALPASYDSVTVDSLI